MRNVETLNDSENADLKSQTCATLPGVSDLHDVNELSFVYNTMECNRKVQILNHGGCSASSCEQYFYSKGTIYLDVLICSLDDNGFSSLCHTSNICVQCINFVFISPDLYFLFKFVFIQPYLEKLLHGLFYHGF